MSDPRDGKNALAVTCVCGGWVMMAVLGHNAQSDRETFREAGKMASEGFVVRTPITVEERRQLKACKHHGECTTDPAKVAAAAQQIEMEMEA